MKVTATILAKYLNGWILPFHDVNITSFFFLVDHLSYNEHPEGAHELVELCLARTERP